MTRDQLFEQIRRKSSYLCVGLDPDIHKIPKHLLKTDDPLFEFNRQIIDATYESCIAYKPNLAFYEAMGPRGWESLQKTVEYIPNGIFSIADAKRGDIGNTASLYAQAFFDYLNFDAITVAPYMGADSVTPFLYRDKWVILLAHTSNAGSADFQLFESANGKKLYEEVISRSRQWATVDQLMYVVGATRADRLHEIRALAPGNFFLVPGIGAQGGDLAQVSRAAMNKECGLIVNSSRAIIYASDGEDFATRAGVEARKVRDEMEGLLASAGI